MSQATKIQGRKLLFENVEEILTSLVARREKNKNQSDDLFSMFGGGDSTQESQSKINLEPKNKLTDLEILMLEKNALGIYLTQNPLDEYKDLEKYLRRITGLDNLFLVLVEKYKRVFTKKGAMMIVLDLTTTEGSLEGVIFSKQAIRLLPNLEEKTLCWVLGAINNKNENKPMNNLDQVNQKAENNQIPALIAQSEVSENLEEINETEKGDPENPNSNSKDEVESQNLGLEEGSEAFIEEKTYEEKPKMLINEITKSENGIRKLIENAEKIRYKDKFLNRIPSVDWTKIINNIKDWKDLIKVEIQGKPNASKMGTKTVQVYLSPDIGPKLSLIKNSLKKEIEAGDNSIYFQAEVFIKKEGEYKKAKGEFWIKDDIYNIYNSIISEI